MTADEARQLVIGAIADIAPDTDPASLAPGDDLQETLDLDSMDLMNLVVAVAESTGADISDRDAARLRTLGAWTAYLAG